MVSVMSTILLGPRRVGGVEVLLHHEVGLQPLVHMLRVEEGEVTEVDGVGGGAGHSPMVGVDLGDVEGVFGDDDIRPVLADEADELLPQQPRRQQGQFQVGVFQKDGRLSAQDGSRARRLLPADRGQRLRVVLKGAFVAAGRDDDDDPRAFGDHLRDGPSGEDLRVVRMRGENQDRSGHNTPFGIYLPRRTQRARRFKKSLPGILRQAPQKVS